jgi:predicted small integral membrane protein
MTELRSAEAKPFFHSWYDYNWDWAAACFFALVLLAGVAVWTSADRPQTSAMLDDTTTGQGTRLSPPPYFR